MDMGIEDQDDDKIKMNMKIKVKHFWKSTILLSVNKIYMLKSQEKWVVRALNQFISLILVIDFSDIYSNYPIRIAFV